MVNGGNRSPENRVLLVEGEDERHVVRHICESNSLPASFCIREKGGRPKLLASIRSEILAEGRIAVGIVVDANNNSQSRWQSIAHKLGTAGITTPAGPDSNGTIIGGQPRVGIWLMPDNKSPGELEDFIASMIPSEDPVWPLSKDYIDAIPEEHREFKEGKIQRAKVHAWLAAREEPRLMGSAIGRGDLETNSGNCKKFMGWLRKLFEHEV